MRKFFAYSLILSLIACSPLLAQDETINEQQILSQLKEMEAAKENAPQQAQQQGQQQTQQQAQQQGQQQQGQQQGQQQQVQQQGQQQQTQQQGQQQQTQQQGQQQQTQQQGQQQQTQQQGQQQQTQQQGQQQQAQQQGQQQQGQQQGQQQQAQQQGQQQQTQQQNVQEGNKIGPNWTVGQQWVIETTNTQTQNADSTHKSAPVQWLFQVTGEVELLGQLCYQLKIQSLQEGVNQPFVDLWVAKENGMIVRVTSHIFVKGAWRESTETYQTKGKSTPVLGTIPSLPLDMPSFSQIGAKDTEANIYKIVTEKAGSKGADEVGFVYRVQQKSQKAVPEQSKSLLSPKAKGLEKVSLQDAVEIEINGGSKSAKQVWTPGLPWPIYSANGTCEARLIQTFPVSNPQK